MAQLAQCLRDSLSGHDVAAQKNAEQVSIISGSEQQDGYVADTRADAPASKELSGY